MFDQDILIADLRFEVKVLRDEVEAFKSGEKYVRMEEEFHRCRRADAKTIRRLEKERDAAREEARHVRDLWFETCDQLVKDIEKLNGKLDKEHEKLLKKIKELYRVKTNLEEEKEKNKSLRTKLKKNHTNSSKSSSMDPNHGTIHNSREKSGKAPGAQQGHEHHGRKKQEPTSKILIPAPEEYLDKEKYTPTGKIIRRQLVRVHIDTEVIEYYTREFREKESRKRVHAPFPEGVTNDVNYDGTVKAIAYMINNDLYTFNGYCYTNDVREIKRQMIQEIPVLKDSQRTEVYKYLDLIVEEHTETEARYICFANGIYDIVTETLNPFSPGYIVTNKITAGPRGYFGNKYRDSAC